MGSEGQRLDHSDVRDNFTDCHIERCDSGHRRELILGCCLSVALRHTILTIIPEAEQCISYAMPTFKVRGKAIAGFAAFKNHLSYFPHSGSVIPELGRELAQYKASKGTLQFPIDQPLPKAIVEKLVAVRLRQAFGEANGAEGA